MKICVYFTGFKFYALLHVRLYSFSSILVWIAFTI